MEPTRGADVAQGPPRLISVIIPVRNGGPLLQAQLDALAAQDYRGAWEVVVADNRSTDGTAERVAERAATFPVPLRCVPTPDRPGCAVARNAGSLAAAGDFFVYCDADDEVAPGWLSAMAAAAQHGGVVAGRLETTRINTPVVASWRPALPPGRLPVALGYLPYATGANTGIWANVWHEIGGYDERFAIGGDDAELSWRAQLAGHALVPADDAVVHYRYRSELRDFAKQYVGYGMGEPALYAAYRDRIRRRSPLAVLLTVLWLVKHLPDLLAGERARGVWVREAAYYWGRVRGSLRARTVFL